MAQTSSFAKELAQILTLLNAHHIPVIVLKGAYLAEATQASGNLS